MFINDRDFKVVLILGAGATRGAIPHILLNRKRIKPPLNRDFFKVADTYARAQGSHSADGKRLKSLDRFFHEYLPIRKLDLNMETAFSFLFTAKDFPQIYRATRGRRRRAGDYPEIEDFLKLTFRILTILDQSNCKETAYDKLVSLLKSDDTLITLNYDTLLDSALMRRGWNPQKGYCLGIGKGKVHWEPSRLFSNTNLNNVRLLKLHGSVNWFVRGSFSNLSSVFAKKPSRVESPRINEIGGYIRQIVPPIYGKFFSHDHWRNLWTKAYYSLCESEVLIVIGCSLVDTDFHLRSLMARVCKWRREEKKFFKRVILVDRSRVRKKWAKVLKGSFLKKSHYVSFAEFLRRG